MVVGPLRVTAQTAAELSTLDTQLSTLSKQLQIIQANKTLNANPAFASQITNNLSQINQLQKGVSALNGLVNAPALGGVGGTVNGVNTAIQSIQEIAGLPALQNFTGLPGLSAQLGQIGDVTSFISSAQAAISNPNVQTIGVLARALDQGAPLLQGLGITGTGNLGAIAGAGGLISNPSQILQNPAQAVSILTQAGSALSGFLGGDTAKAISGISNVSGLGEATGFVKALAAPSGISTSFDQVIGGASCGGGDIVQGFVRAQANKVLGSALKRGLSSITGGVISGDVNTIEQDGPLLQLTAQNKQLTDLICQHLSEIRAVERKLLEVQTELLNKEKKDDPAAFEKTGGQLAEIRKGVTTQVQNRVVTDPNGQQQNFGSSFQTLKEFTREKTNAAVIGAIDSVKKANKNYEFSQSLIDEIVAEQELEDAKSSGRADALISMVLAEKPSEDPGDILSNLVAASSPQNTYYGRRFMSQQLIDQIQTEAAEEAKTTYIAGQGVSPSYKECAVYQKLENGKLHCLEYKIAVPGSIVANRYSAAVNSDIGFVVSGGEAGNTGTTEKITTTILQQAQTPPGITISDVFSVLDTICEIVPANSVCGTKKKTTPTFASDLDSGSVTLGGGGVFTTQTDTNLEGSEANLDQFSGTDGSITTTPKKPTLTTRVVNNLSFEDVNVSTISWSSTNTTSCVAKNAWITFGDGSRRTASSTIVAVDGDEIGTGGSFDVFHPTLFKLSARALPSFGDTDGITPLDQTDIVTRFSSTTQTTVYTPLMTGVETTDRFEILLNGKALTTKKDLPTPTQEALILELKNAKNNLSNSDSRFAEYNKVIFDGTSSLVVVAHSTSTIETFANYDIECRGNGGVISKTVNLVF